MRRTVSKSRSSIAARDPTVITALLRRGGWLEYANPGGINRGAGELAKHGNL
jgi:hypothetical protein